MASTLSSKYRELKRADDEIFQRKLNMGMAQHNRVQCGRIKGELTVSANRFLTPPLVQATF
jgi:hypothetical protein